MAVIVNAIVERRKRLADLKQEVAAVGTDLDALLKAAQIMGITVPDDVAFPPPSDRGSGVNRGGKPRGAISGAWRKVLASLLPTDSSHTLLDVRAAAEMHGITSEMGAVRDRVRKYGDLGYLKKTDDGRYSVTEEAVGRLNLNASKEDVPTAKELSDALAG
ncbi:hypothetical protein [Rhodopila sp.]|uniref:hypothetical protein n=1 Tax=Rhodopila sp. TaxID=2480087 RepID=UPI003D0DF359